MVVGGVFFLFHLFGFLQGHRSVGYDMDVFAQSI
jgi:hypothetical protein